MNDDRTCKSHALLLPAREAFRQAVLIVRNLHDVKDAVNLLLHLGLRHIAQLESVFHILTHRQVGEDCVTLKYHANVPLVCRNIVDTLLIEQDVPAFNRIEARNHAEKGRLATARGAKQGKELAVMNTLRQSRNDGEVAVFLHGILNVNRYAHIISSNRISNYRPRPYGL